MHLNKTGRPFVAENHIICVNKNQPIFYTILRGVNLLKFLNFLLSPFSFLTFSLFLQEQFVRQVQRHVAEPPHATVDARIFRKILGRLCDTRSASCTPDTHDRQDALEAPRPRWPTPSSSAWHLVAKAYTGSPSPPQDLFSAVWFFAKGEASDPLWCPRGSLHVWPTPRGFSFRERSLPFALTSPVTSPATYKGFMSKNRF